MCRVLCLSRTAYMALAASFPLSVALLLDNLMKQAEEVGGACIGLHGGQSGGGLLGGTGPCVCQSTNQSTHQPIQLNPIQSNPPLPPQLVQREYYSSFAAGVAVENLADVQALALRRAGPEVFEGPGGEGGKEGGGGGGGNAAGGVAGGAAPVRPRALRQQMVSWGERRLPSRVLAALYVVCLG